MDALLRDIRLEARDALPARDRGAVIAVGANDDAAVEDSVAVQGFADRLRQVSGVVRSALTCTLASRDTSGSLGISRS